MNLFSYKRYILWSILALLLSVLIYFAFVLTVGSTFLINEFGFPADLNTLSSGMALALSAAVIFVILSDVNNYTIFSFWIIIVLLTFIVAIVFFIIENFT